jgi:hypothetical protein
MLTSINVTLMDDAVQARVRLEGPSHEMYEWSRLYKRDHGYDSLMQLAPSGDTTGSGRSTYYIRHTCQMEDLPQLLSGVLYPYLPDEYHPLI